MKADDAVVIRGLRLFHEARDETFADLIEAGFLQRFPPGVLLIQESDRADFLHVVVEGLVEIFATTAGRETTMDLIRPVGVFILAPVLSEQAYLQSARTLEKSRILMIPAEKVRRSMTLDPSFMRAIVIELAHGYRRVIKDLKNHKLRTGTERLANWLIHNEIDQGRQGFVDIPFEKRVLASRLGMTPENLSRAFAALRSHGVKVKGIRIEITEPEGLARFALPNALIDAPEGHLSIQS